MSDFALDLYRRAPASVLTIASLAASYAVTRCVEDYMLFKLVGAGGLGEPSFGLWLLHTFILRPLALGAKASTDPDFLPLDDDEWAERLRQVTDRKERADTVQGCSQLEKRKSRRPLVYGVVPQRQLLQKAEQKEHLSQAIVQHMHDLARYLPLALELALSTYEGSSSPALYVRHVPEQNLTGTPGMTHDFARPTRLAQMYLAGTPAPMRSLQDKPLPRDATKHELLHVHLSDGSLHMTLSPQDARRVVAQHWGELHRLAGIAYRGTWLPPYWLPSWLGNTPQRRWLHQQRQLEASMGGVTPAGRLVPPTYVMVYAPRNESELASIKTLIDASVSWAIGRPL